MGTIPMVHLISKVEPTHLLEMYSWKLLGTYLVVTYL